MKSRKVVLAGGLALSLVALAAGCGSSSSTSTPAASSKPVSGGDIVIAEAPQTNVNWFFPLVNSSYDSLYNSQIINMMYTPLIWINSNYNIDWAASAASNITYNKAGTVYHVFLHKNMKWSDGQPVTAQDSVFTWNLIKATSATNAPSPWPYVGAGSGDIPTGVKSVVANNEYEFTVTLNTPASQEWFIYNGLEDILPLPEQTLNKYPTNITKEIKWIGSEGTNPKFDTVVDGPYKLTSATANESWTLTPNASYSGKKAYDKLTFVYEGSNSAEFAGLKTGTVDVGYLDPSEFGAKSELTNDRLFTMYGEGFFDIELNMLPNAQNGLGKVFANDLYVRQALEEDINQNAVNQDIYHDTAPAAYGPIANPPKTSFYAPALDKPLYPYNPTAAKKLLTSHGWTEQNGVMTKDGVKLQFTLLYSGGSTSTDDNMALIQSEWKHIGVDVILKSEPFASLEGVISTPSEAAEWGAAGGQGIDWGGSYPSGNGVFQPGGLDNFGYNNAEENSLITETSDPAPSPAQGLKELFQWEVYTAKDLPVLWQNNYGTINAVATNVHGVKTYSNPVTSQPQYQFWWTSK